MIFAVSLPTIVLVLKLGHVTWPRPI